MKGEKIIDILNNLQKKIKKNLEYNDNDSFKLDSNPIHTKKNYSFKCISNKLKAITKKIKKLSNISEKKRKYTRNKKERKRILKRRKKRKKKKKSEKK